MSFYFCMGCLHGHIYGVMSFRTYQNIEAALHCDKAWGQYAEKNQIRRYDEFYLLKMQEELGELSRSFLELRGSEKKHKSSEDELKKKFAADITKHRKKCSNKLLAIK